MLVRNVDTTFINCEVSLPVINGNINFPFIEKFVAELEAHHIAELEAHHIAELEAYLSVTGLKDYELTEEETETLANFEENKVNWGLFKYKDIFDNIKQGRRLKKHDQIDGDIPFVMSGVTNTGVVNYISNPVTKFPQNSITLDIFGNAFYRSYDFGAGDDTGVYWSTTNRYSPKTMLFIAAAMQKSVLGKYSYGKKLRSSQSHNIELALPITENKPDINFMENLISAIQKLVIKDVVLYSDRRIEKTKSIIMKDNE